MKKINIIIIILSTFCYFNYVNANESFEDWKVKFKNYAQIQGVSSTTLNRLIDNSRFLPDVIKYDRYQPEFYEDTKTYISKRASNKKLKIGNNIFINNINKVNFYLTLLNMIDISLNFMKIQKLILQKELQIKN